MHPVLAKYLSLDAAVDTLRRDEQGHSLRAEERPFAKVARAHPEKRDAVLSARGKRQAPPEAQEALLFLGAHAAAASLEEDGALAAPLGQARAALAGEGADESEIDRFIATLVLEEAFGYGEEDVDRFDRPFFAETLESVPRLAKLSRAGVEELYGSFARGAEPDWRAAHQLAAQCLLEAAWAEGPEPINPEHVEEALERLRERLPDSERARAGVALRRFLGTLAEAALVGPIRLGRLLDVVDRADSGPGGPVN